MTDLETQIPRLAQKGFDARHCGDISAIMQEQNIYI